MTTATTVTPAQREPELLGQTVVVIGGSAGTVSRVGPVLREPAGARRGLRHPRQVVVPDGRLPHLRDGLISGEVSYRPDPLEPPAPGSTLICCSQARGEATLDL